MNLRKQLKKDLGERYCYRRYMSACEVKKKMIGMSEIEEQLVATMIVGCIKINAVICFKNREPQIVLDIFVKDTPTSPEWICFDSLNDNVRLTSYYLEQDMFNVMNREVVEHNLSYTDCNFEQIEGKIIGKF
jgi:hypothetical protein